MTLFVIEKRMAFKEDKCKYADNHREEEEVEESTATSNQ
jgi:hypothetical protein